MSTARSSSARSTGGTGAAEMTSSSTRCESELATPQSMMCSRSVRASVSSWAKAVRAEGPTTATRAPVAASSACSSGRAERVERTTTSPDDSPARYETTKYQLLAHMTARRSLRLQAEADQPTPEARHLIRSWP